MIIHGSDVDLSQLSDVKSLSDLKRIGIFSHLDNEDEANDELWAALRPDVVTKVKLPEWTDEKPEE